MNIEEMNDNFSVNLKSLYEDIKHDSKGTKILIDYYLKKHNLRKPVVIDLMNKFVGRHWKTSNKWVNAFKLKEAIRSFFKD